MKHLVFSVSLLFVCRVFLSCNQNKNKSNLKPGEKLNFKHVNIEETRDSSSINIAPLIPMISCGQFIGNKNIDSKIITLIALDLLKDDNIHEQNIFNLREDIHFNFKGLGPVVVWTGKIKAEAVYFDKEFCVLLSPAKRMASLLFLSKPTLVKDYNYDTCSYFAGTANIRGVGFFTIYSYEMNKLKAVFASDLPTKNESLGCISYENSYLKFSNSDLDSDGLLDLSFKGKAFSYCNGLELGFNRQNRKPQAFDSVSINYIRQKADGLIWIRSRLK